ncbi:MAG: PilZ domain-containing protein [Proteobacteria bacterium]|nr:PilZ domain-containing protein [Pseudomonadota bacterium]MBU1688962.1 PilZ domain-containing protein [Pseudomonadota bacterium]
MLFFSETARTEQSQRPIRSDTTPPWQISRNEFTPIDHPTSIDHTLTTMRDSHLFLNLTGDYYLSGQTILTDFDQKNLMFDKPLDWPEALTSSQVYFKDRLMIWSFFEVNIVCTTPDTLYTTVPTRLYRLQRRQYFRISPPLGSKASFQLEDQSFNSLAVNDLSAGGMLVSTNSPETPLADSVVLDEIKITIPQPVRGKTSETVLPIITQGKVVRSFQDPKTNRRYFGICFQNSPEIRDEISRYVIQREQELLRR